MAIFEDINNGVEMIASAGECANRWPNCTREPMGDTAYCESHQR